MRSGSRVSKKDTSHAREAKRSADKRQPYSGSGLINLEFGNASRDKFGSANRLNQSPQTRNDRHLIKEKQRDPSMDFKKVHVDPSLFKIQVQRKHLERLMNDDMDEISKFEVVYKILKDQLRNHQKHLIELKEKDKKDKADKRKEKKMLTEIELSEFCKHIKPFEFYGSQRDLSPELKRIVKNLTCQEHQYVYCACCKQYD